MKRILLIATCMLMIPQFIKGRVQSNSRNQNIPTTSSIEELKKLDADLDKAFIRGDKTVFERILADEMISVSAEGDLARKTDILNQISRPLKLSIRADDVRVYLFGNTAIVSSHKAIKYGSDASTSDRYRETNTYVRGEDGWQLIASQQSHVPPPYSPKEVQLDLKIEDVLMKGSKKAPVVLVEFLDYQCPHCRHFAAETMKQLEKNYIRPGRVGFILRHLPSEELHENAFKAADAARCAGEQGKFWEMSNLLLREPMALTNDDLLADARSLKLDMTKFCNCFSDVKTAMAIRQDMLEAAGMGVKGTPIFLVGLWKPNERVVKIRRMIQGDYPYDVFKATLDTLLNASSP